MHPSGLRKQAPDVSTLRSDPDMRVPSKRDLEQFVKELRMTKRKRWENDTYGLERTKRPRLEGGEAATPTRGENPFLTAYDGSVKSSKAANEDEPDDLMENHATRTKTISDTPLKIQVKDKRKRKASEISGEEPAANGMVKKARVVLSEISANGEACSAQQSNNEEAPVKSQASATLSKRNSDATGLERIEETAVKRYKASGIEGVATVFNHLTVTERADDSKNQLKVKTETTTLIEKATEVDAVEYCEPFPHYRPPPYKKMSGYCYASSSLEPKPGRIFYEPKQRKSKQPRRGIPNKGRNAKGKQAPSCFDGVLGNCPQDCAGRRHKEAAKSKKRKYLKKWKD